MPHLRPQIELSTRAVRNQPPAFEDVNLWPCDLPLREAVLREGADPSRRPSRSATTPAATR